MVAAAGGRPRRGAALRRAAGYCRAPPPGAAAAPRGSCAPCLAFPLAPSAAAPSSPSLQCASRSFPLFLPARRRSAGVRLARAPPRSCSCREAAAGPLRSRVRGAGLRAARGAAGGSAGDARPPPAVALRVRCAVRGAERCAAAGKNGRGDPCVSACDGGGSRSRRSSPRTSAVRGVGSPRSYFLLPPPEPAPAERRCRTAPLRLPPPGAGGSGRCPRGAPRRLCGRSGNGGGERRPRRAGAHGRTAGRGSFGSVREKAAG